MAAVATENVDYFLAKTKNSLCLISGVQILCLFIRIIVATVFILMSRAKVPLAKHSVNQLIVNLNQPNLLIE